MSSTLGLVFGFGGRRCFYTNLGKSPDRFAQYTVTEPTGGGEIDNEHRNGAFKRCAPHIDRYEIQFRVLLDDTNGNDGPFVYWPESHAKVLQAARDELARPLNERRSGPQPIYDSLDHGKSDTPCKFTSTAGDIIISHQLVAHRTLRNRGNRRRMAFFRVGHRQDAGYSMFTDPWGDFAPEIRDIAKRCQNRSRLDGVDSHRVARQVSDMIHGGTVHDHAR
jgi:hypothetical protein